MLLRIAVSSEVRGSVSMWLEPDQRTASKVLPVLTSLMVNLAFLGITLVTLSSNQSSVLVVYFLVSFFTLVELLLLEEDEEVLPKRTRMVTAPAMPSAFIEFHFRLVSGFHEPIINLLHAFAVIPDGVQCAGENIDGFFRYARRPFLAGDLG